MGLRFSALCAVFCIGVSAASSPEVSPQEWAGALVAHELRALEESFGELRAAGGLSGKQLERVQDLSRTLRDTLSQNPNEELLRAASLKYLVLTDALAVARLAALARDEAPGSLLDPVKTQADALVGLAVAGADEAVIAEKLHEVEAATEKAQIHFLSGKRRQAIQTAVLRLHALSDLDPTTRTANDFATLKLHQALHSFQSGDQAGAEASVAEALQKAFGSQANWDGRHLWHLLQTRLLVLSTLQQNGLPEGVRASLQSELQALTKAETDYEDRAAALHKRCADLSPGWALDPEHQLHLAPELVQTKLAQQIGAIAKWVPEVREAFLKNETFLQSFHIGYKTQVLKQLDEMQAAMDQASELLRHNTNYAVLSRFFRSASHLQTVTLYTLESILDRSAATPKYLSAWKNGLERLSHGMPFMTPEDHALLSKALKIERREGVRSAWFTRHNASVVATTVLVGAALAGEAFAAPATLGGSTLAMPATLALITTVSVASAKTVLLTNAALNIADRAKIKGVKGLANMDTAFDALVLVSLSPRPIIGAVPATGFLGKMGQGAANSFAGLQYSSAAALAVLGPSYGAYLVWNAEVVSEQMRQEGVAISPAEIRRKGLVNVALGMLALGSNREYYRAGVWKNGPAFEEALKPSTFFGGTLPRYLSQFRQIKSLRDTYAANPGLMGKLLTVGTGLGYVGMDTLLVTEGLIFSYSNLDSNFVSHAEKVHPLPELRENESAVIMVGFESSDYFLYAGAQAPYSNRQEVQKFGKKLFLYTYKSAEDLMNTLEKHRKKNGPVRYLKISTHGRPGRLFTPAVSASPEGALSSGWIDREWLSDNKDKLTKQSRRIFAPAAQIRLWACLVGANLDEDAGEGLDIGEKFVQELGETWLSKGGSIDASTRILVGLDSTVGALGDHVKREGLRPLSARPNLVLPVTSLIEDSEAWQFEGEIPAQDTWQSNLAYTMETGRTMARRLVNIFGHWPPIWWEYGVNLEGPFWQSRYRSMEFPAR